MINIPKWLNPVLKYLSVVGERTFSIIDMLYDI